MIRRFGEVPRADQTYRPRPGAYALLPRDGQLLLTCQYDPAPDIQLPGGGIDPGESPIPALHREVYEETGWKIAAPRRIGAFRRFVYMPEYDLWAEKLCHIYLARPVLRLSDPVEANHRAIWMPIQDAAAILGNSGDRHFAALLADL
ncbi:NUDIX hydrolase [Phaeobacter sp. HF9A]|uniref:NUDIX hydrolase n=1 Tax=Phaeobacter sp. HF9A TaxID=2721561 RepID=UPI00142FDB4B|nr:NUDIX hydrolase [Phaeobacter sp. HF9A]